MHSIFQIRISRNKKCADKTSIPRPGHICGSSKAAKYTKILILDLDYTIYTTYTRMLTLVVNGYTTLLEFI